MSVEEEVKMVLFSRWMAKEFDSAILNNENSYFYRRQLTHFNDVVYPNFIKNGTVKDHIDSFNNTDTIKEVINDLP